MISLWALKLCYFVVAWFFVLFFSFLFYAICRSRDDGTMSPRGVLFTLSILCALISIGAGMLFAMIF